jgi:hypothetical protein
MTQAVPHLLLFMNNTYTDGYFIQGSYQTVAWYKTKQEAEAMCRKMNYGMSTGFYKVIPSYCTREKFVELAKH